MPLRRAMGEGMTYDILAPGRLRVLFPRALSRRVAVLALGLTLVPALAPAQDLARDVQNLKRDLADLQRYIYTGQKGSPPALGAPATDSGGAAISGDIMAHLQIHLQDLERRLREMTGKLEEAQFKQRQLEQRMDKALADMEYRMTVLEGDTPNIATSAADGPSQPVIPVPGPSGGARGTTLISSQGMEKTGGQRPMAPRGHTLGSLILDAEGNVIGGGFNPDATVGSGPLNQTDRTTPPPNVVQAPAPVEGGDLASTGDGAAVLPDGPQALYDHSLGLIRRGKYPEAESALRVFLDRYPENDLVGAALYWLGETYYVRGNYRDAAFAFVDVYGKHKTSPKVPDSLLKLGMSLNALGNKKEACSAFATLKADYPDARRAVLKLAEERAAEFGC